jgi:HSP20 family molecular chaperone IbpA
MKNVYKSIKKSKSPEIKDFDFFKDLLQKFQQKEAEKEAESISKEPAEIKPPQIIDETDSLSRFITILLPNVYKDALQIESCKNELTVKFIKHEDDSANFLPNSFTETFIIGSEFDIDNIKPFLRYGVLNIQIPKLKQVETEFVKKIIQIN